MKRILITSIISVCTTIVSGQTIDTNSLSEYDQNKPIGFAASVTGGEGGTTVTVENFSQLQDELPANNTDKKIIIVKGTITFDGQLDLRGIKNKTIIGFPGTTFENMNEDVATSEDDKKAAIKKTGILLVYNCENIVIRNITFKSAGACDFNANDNLCIQGSQNIWVDHCDFQDGVDGNLDIVNGSDNVSVTWCRFRYLLNPRGHGYGGSSDDHRFTSLIGNGDSQAGDEGKLNTTFVNCWWDNGCKERMPRVRFGKVHTLNCLYSSDNTNYCVGGGYKSNVYIEKCAFTSNKAKTNPWKKYATSSGKTDYNVTITGCQGASDKQEKSGDIDYFIPAYDYTAYDATLVETVVSNESNGAGATLKFDTAGINAISIKGSELNPKMPRYNIKGQQVDSNYKGLVIQGGRKYMQK
jgi:pectate lyase